MSGEKASERASGEPRISYTPFAFSAHAIPRSHVFRLSMIRRFLYLRLLRIVLVVGGLYDLLFAFLLAIAPEIPSRALGVPTSDPGFLSPLMPVFLLMIGFLAVVAAREPRRYSAVIAATIGGRLLGAFVLAAAAWERADLQGLWFLVGANVLLGGTIAWFWGGWRR